ncbi:quinon protein alcohol dehydrogenase-like superfamily [Baffinella frigidus]|nr:quinon protein alcohol dehydrogenase-like superfamily [Cryptophyta sp. CCMP2293]
MMPLSKWLVVGKRGAQPRGGTRPSEDTLRRLLPFLVEHVGPEVVLLLSQACKPWRHELETRGFCSRTCQLLLTLASVNRPQLGHEDEDPDEEEDEAPEVRVLFARLGHNALQRLAANPSSWMVSANSFLQRRWDWRGSLHEWLQFASQEPTGSFARCAASTAEALSLKLVLWVNKPQWSYPGIATLAGHSGEVTSVAYNADGTRIVSGSWDMTVKIWDVATGATMHTLGHTCTGRCRCAMKHVVDYEGKRKLVKHRQCPLKGHSGEVHCVAFSPDGKRVVSASNDFRVKIWNVETGAEVCTLTGHTGQVYSVAFSPDGKLVVSGSGDKLVKIWNTETGAEVLTLGGQQVRTLTVERCVRRRFLPGFKARRERISRRHREDLGRGDRGRGAHIYGE